MTARALTELPRLGPKTAEAFADLGIETLGELLHHLTRGYQDRTRLTPVRDLTPGDVAVVRGKVVAVRQGRRRGRRPGSFEARLDDGSGALTVSFFGAPWVAKEWTEGREVLVLGRTERKAPLRLTHPEVVLDPEEDAGWGAVVPVYATPDGVSQRALRRWMSEALDREPIAPLLPPGVRPEGLPSRLDALRRIHFPTDAEGLDALRAGTSMAHEALLFDDLVALQAALLRRRFVLRGEGAAADALPRGRAGGARRMATLRARAEARLSFSLTGAQERVLGEIDADLSTGGRAMQRLVQGDVGSGKTVVGLLAAAPVLERGGQVAVLAPTDVLARQWKARSEHVFGPLGVRVGWLAGGGPADERRAEREAVASGAAGLVVGTHALFSDGVEFARLALVIVDEQQRFGVFQRARLLDKGPQPHLLALSATPIPRSLARTLYGDLDLSLLDERPPRGPVVTEVLASARRRRAWEAVRRAAEAGERAFVVCARVEASTGDPVRGVLATAEELANGALAGIPLGVLHGGMSSEDKERALDALRSGRLRVLVTTTVVEVGVDVPEATVLVVENAERFGLAQLHQLRGRVGRSERGGRCILLTPSPDEAPRLAVLAETADGFAVAEADLRQRGPGDLVGARQAGRPALRLAWSPRFLPLLRRARALAAQLVARDDWETADELAALRAAAAAALPESHAVRAG